MAKTREDLLGLKCVPCRGGVPPLDEMKIKTMIELTPGWNWIRNGPDKIEKQYKFKDFKGSMKFVNKLADLAEEEGHHPDITIHWNLVTLTLWTHVINGLFDNDFILAAKVDEL